MGTIRIDNKDKLNRFLETLVNESVKKAKRTPLLREDYAELQREADDERDKQEKAKAAKSDVDSLFGDSGGDEESGGEEEQKEKNPAPEPEPEVLSGEVDTSDAAAQSAKAITVSQNIDGVVDLLNLIRSGRSLKNADVLQELTTWLEAMSDAQTLFTVTILAGIKDIVTAGETAEEAEDPDESGVSVTMPKEEDVDSQRKSPGDTGGGEAPTRSQVKSVEDTTVPIVVGRRTEAYNRAFRAKIRKLMGD